MKEKNTPPEGQVPELKYAAQMGLALPVILAKACMLSQGSAPAAQCLLTLEMLRSNYPPSARLFLSPAGGQSRRGRVQK